MTEKTGIRVRDPVCGRILDLAEVVATDDHGGWAHFFCSATCRDAFRDAPDQYAQDTPPHGAATLNHGD